MRFAVHPSTRIRRTIKKLKRSGKGEILEALAEVTELLSVSNAPAAFVLREEWNDHALKGTLQGSRELHLGFDQLLVYEVKEKERIIKLIDITTHEQLRKW